MQHATVWANTNTGRGGTTLTPLWPCLRRPCAPPALRLRAPPPARFPGCLCGMSRRCDRTARGRSRLRQKAASLERCEQAEKGQLLAYNCTQNSGGGASGTAGLSGTLCLALTGRPIGSPVRSAFRKWVGGGGSKTNIVACHVVPWNWADVGVQLDEQKMNRMRCEKQRREDAGKVGEGLHWVHRQAAATHIDKVRQRSGPTSATPRDPAHAALGIIQKPGS